MTALPRHQPTRCKKTADDSEDDKHVRQGRYRPVQEEVDKHPDLNQDERAPCHDPESEMTHRGREATRHPCAAGAERAVTSPSAVIAHSRSSADSSAQHQPRKSGWTAVRY